jgi:cysteinyl-tRNA synthetase
MEIVYGLRLLRLETTIFSSVYRRIPPYTTRRYTTVIRSHVIRRISPYTVVYDRACLTWESSNGVIGTEVLQRYNANQIRLFCLMNPWLTTVDFNEDEMNKILVYHQLMEDYFNITQSYKCKAENKEYINIYTKFDEQDLILYENYKKFKNEIHLSLCRSIHTASAMEYLLELILLTSDYLRRNRSYFNDALLMNIYIFIKRLLGTFGLDLDLY